MAIHSHKQAGDVSYWLALMHAPGIGPVTYQTLLQHYGHPERLFDKSGSAPAAFLPKSALEYLRNPDWSAVERDLFWQEQPGNYILTFHDAAYPPLLREIPDPPPVLFARGNVQLLSSLQLAIVGSRNPSPVGQETAYEFAKSLSGHGLTITSGLAMGIDAAGHRGALDNKGFTLAVMGCGLDQVYPARHQQLAQQVAEHGVLISEFAPGIPPLAENFPRRNRIISGLSAGTLVVEAALRSGSLITARLALEQGREVFAVPGSIHNPLARGCHQLIRQGAKLVENTQDILEELGPLAEAAFTQQQASPATGPGTTHLDQTHSRVLDKLGFDPTSIDTLVERTGLTAEALSSILLVLELHDKIMSVPGGFYIRLGERN